MLSADDKKLIMRAIRKTVLVQVSAISLQRINAITESDLGVTDFSNEIWENTLRCLRLEGNAELVERSNLEGFDHLHRIRTTLGNLKLAHNDLKDNVPPEVDFNKLAHWDSQWDEQRSRSKRMKIMQAETLPKHVLNVQDMGSRPGGSQDPSGTGTIARTLHNSKCGMLLTMPSDVLVQGTRIGAGSFGTVHQVTVRGVSFFPEHITYCAKTYKGEGTTKFDSFQIEQGMQVLNPSIVRCIAFTQAAPWITIFPYYNGGSVGQLLLTMPVQRSTFARIMWRLNGNINQPPPADIIPSSLQMSQIRSVYANMPHIMHALVDGLAAAHGAGILHTDLHPFNVVLDFTRDMQARVGIIDWGLLLRSPAKRPSCNYVRDFEKNVELLAKAQAEMERKKFLRPWVAPECYDPRNNDAFTEASDIYSLGFLLEKLHEFWRIAGEKYNLASIDTDIMERIKARANTWMLVSNPTERKNIFVILEFFRSLNTEPVRAQRPLVELTPAFMPM